MTSTHSHPIAAVKPLSLEIPFDAEAVDVVVGDVPTLRAEAARIADALRLRCHGKVEVVDDALYAGWDAEPRHHAIVVGSLGDNRTIEFLYYRWLTFVDHSYPGLGGFVLHTLWEPWGSGWERRPNAIVVGAADPEGLTAAVDRFCAIVESATDGIPRLHEVVYGSSLDTERTQMEACADGGHPIHGWRFPYVGHGMLYHVPQFVLTAVRCGDPRWADGVRELLLDLAASPILKSDPTSIHLYHWPILMAWPLLETSPVYSDEDRLTIARFLYDVIVSAEGYRRPRLYRVVGIPVPRQNHETRCCLGVAFGATYFQRHYDDVPEIADALSVADDVLGFGAVCSKQIEDTNQHGWLTIGDQATYALLTGRTEFFDNGKARIAADRAIANCSSNGFVATAGDGFVSPGPQYFLTQVAFYCRDAQVRFVVENEAQKITGPRGDAPARSRYSAGLAAELPEAHIGTRVFPLERHFYDIPAVDPEEFW